MVTVVSSNDKGTIAETTCVSTLTRLGYRIALPVNKHLVYDLIADDGTKLLKVQCKYIGASIRKCNGRVKYDGRLTTTKHNKEGWHIRKYNNDSFDLLYIYCSDGVEFLIPWSEVTNRTSIHVHNVKYEKYRISQDLTKLNAT